MTSVFDVAMKAIFADRNMAAQATYFAGGIGSGQILRVLLTKPDVSKSWNAVEVILPTTVIEVAISDLAMIRENDRFEIDGKSYGILGAPERDALHLTWKVGLADWE